jgi:hypothetical protein
MGDNVNVSKLTIGELKALIRETVQEAVAEVLVEFSLAAEHDAEVSYQAEMNDLLRASLHNSPSLMGGISAHDD